MSRLEELSAAVRSAKLRYEAAIQHSKKCKVAFDQALDAQTQANNELDEASDELLEFAQGKRDE